MNRFIFWQRWLLISTYFVILFGLVMVFLNSTELYNRVINDQYNPVFWGNNTISKNAELFQQWVYGAWGATIIGWGIIVAFIAQYPFKRKEKWSWMGLTIMLSVWYLLDTGISLVYRVYANVVLNTILGIMLFLPLFYTRKEFIDK